MSTEVSAVISTEVSAVMSTEASAVISTEVSAVMSTEASAVISTEASGVMSHVKMGPISHPELKLTRKSCNRGIFSTHIDFSYDSYIAYLDEHDVLGRNTKNTPVESRAEFCTGFTTLTQNQKYLLFNTLLAFVPQDKWIAYLDHSCLKRAIIKLNILVEELTPKPLFCISNVLEIMQNGCDRPTMPYKFDYC